MIYKIILMILMIIRMFFSIKNHGKKQDNSNAFYVFIQSLIVLILLYLGGFF